MRLFKTVAKETTHTLRYPDEIYRTETETAQTLEQIGRDPKSLWIGSFFEQNLVGFASFHLPFKDHPHYQHLGSFGMMIAQACWGRGLGRRMLMILEDFAQKIGISKMEALVRAGNERAVGLYLSCGYRIEGLRLGAAIINGDSEDEYYLAKDLSTKQKRKLKDIAS